MPANPASWSLAWKALAESRSQRRATPVDSSSERRGAFAPSQARARLRKSSGASGTVNSLLRGDVAVHVGVGGGPGDQGGDDPPEFGRVPAPVSFDPRSGMPPLGHRDPAPAHTEDPPGDAVRLRAAQPDDQRR